MVESDSYGSDHFPIVLQIYWYFRFLIHYPVGILVVLTG